MGLCGTMPLKDACLRNIMLHFKFTVVGDLNRGAQIYY
jgi:hypothetical protein